MMKFFYGFILLAFMCPIISDAQSYLKIYSGTSYNPPIVVNDPAVMKAAKVKTATVFSYMQKGKGIIKDSAAFMILYYNDSGYLYKWIPKSKLPSVDTLIYEDNFLSKIISVNPARGKPVITDYAYDTLGNLIMKYQYFSDTSSIYIERSEYNLQNRIVRFYTKENLSGFVLTKKYYYENDKLVLVENLNSAGKIVNRDILEYHTDTTFSLYNKFDISTQKKAEYKFDRAGRLLQIKYYQGYFYAGVNNLTYNADGTLFEIKNSPLDRKGGFIRYYYTYYQP